MKPLSYAQRVAWFHQARFGMFIHWGLYAIPGRGEWVMFHERTRPADYDRLADQFTPRRFDADAWASLAAEAGMKYMVFTARHHDGFCLYDSAHSDFTSTRRAARRDFVAEYVTACRRAGLKVGLYYSLLDWRFPGYFDPRRHPQSAQALVQQLHDQVRELLTNYGRIDVLWYDGAWVSHGRVKVDQAEFWRSRQLNAMVRRLQPAIIINNRSGIKEDIDTPEQRVQASEPGRAWESCMTIGDAAGWGYLRHSPNMKTVPHLLQTLVHAAAGEGNFLLNVGPQPDGAIRREEVQRLRALGRWLEVNGQAIYGSQRCELPHGPCGRWTRRGNTGYYHVFRYPGSELVVPLVGTRALGATLLADGRRLKVRQEYNGRLVIKGLPRKPPHPALCVVKVRFAAPPRARPEKDMAAWLQGRA